MQEDSSSYYGDLCYALREQAPQEVNADHRFHQLFLNCYWQNIKRPVTILSILKVSSTCIRFQAAYNIISTKIVVQFCTRHVVEQFSQLLMLQLNNIQGKQKKVTFPFMTQIMSIWKFCFIHYPILFYFPYLQNAPCCCFYPWAFHYDIFRWEN